MVKYVEKNHIWNHEVGKNLHFKSSCLTSNILNNETNFSNALNIEISLLNRQVKVTTGTFHLSVK